jgi:hypothetical protein
VLLRHTDRAIDRYRQTEIHREGEKDREREREIERKRDREREIEGRQIDQARGRWRERSQEREKEIEREITRERERETQSLSPLSVHQWARSAIHASQHRTSPIGSVSWKFPPPPCAVLLVCWKTQCHGKFVRSNVDDTCMER